MVLPSRNRKDVFLSGANASRSGAVAESKDPYPAEYASGNSPMLALMPSPRQSTSGYLCASGLSAVALDPSTVPSRAGAGLRSGVGPAGRLRLFGPGCTKWANR